MTVRLLFFVFLFSGCSQTKLPKNCEVRVEGECFQSESAACTAAGCPDNCIILESYPGQVQCTEPQPTVTKKSVLFVVTGHTALGESGGKTGYYLSEVAHPWKVISDAGFDISFVSVKGGAVQMDPKSRDLDDPINAAFLASDDSKALASTQSPEQVNAETFDAIYFAGGHGAMWDFPNSDALAAIASKIWERGGVVAAVCHGPAGLVNIKLSNGDYLVAGKRVAAFTNDEEEAVKLTETVPFLLAKKLEERGAIHVPGENFKTQVVVDQRLVTGQNPASAEKAAHEIVRLLTDEPQNN